MEFRVYHLGRRRQIPKPAVASRDRQRRRGTPALVRSTHACKERALPDLSADDNGSQPPNRHPKTVAFHYRMPARDVRGLGPARRTDRIFRTAVARSDKNGISKLIGELAREFNFD